MHRLSRGILALTLLAGLAGCAPPGPPDAEAIRALPANASLDARGLGRGGAAARPASVQVQDEPGRPAILYAVSPRLQTGSANSPPMIVTSFGAERQRADGAVAYRAVVVISNARRHADFSGAVTRQNEAVPVQVLGRERRCTGAACLFEEALLLTLPPGMVRRAAEAGQPVRLRLTGSAAFVETAIPPGHLRAALDAVAGAPPR